MARGPRRSGLSGVPRLRRVLRQIEPEMVAPIRAEIADAAEAIRLDAVARAPVDEGDLVRSIGKTFGRDGLTAVIGPGARGVRIMQRRAGSAFATRTADLKISKAARRDLFQFFKGFWIEFGTVRTAARPFMNPAFEANRAYFMARVRRAVDRALERASRGV